MINVPFVEAQIFLSTAPKSNARAVDAMGAFVTNVEEDTLEI
jgi:hypothetical protein